MPLPHPVHLNVDLGELDDEPDELFALATQANVACGAHAGSEALMRRACGLAKASRTRVRAHPGYPDRTNFGRVSMAMSPAALAQETVRQCLALRAIARESGTLIDGAKPHGALYHDVARDDALAEAFVGAVFSVFPQPIGRRLSFVGPGRIGDTSLARAARRLGCDYEPEGFADRRYDPDGRLVPRGRPDALVTAEHEAVEQALWLIRDEGSPVVTLCVHGDGPRALPILRAVGRALADAGRLAGR